MSAAGFLRRLFAGVMPVIGLTLAMSLAPDRASAAATDLSDLPDEIRALIMKEQAKGHIVAPDRAGQSGGASSSGGGKSGCNLDVGNVDTGGKGSGPRNVTTVITGPVIQMNNKCK